MKYIVYEYTDKASPHYVGTRFMTSDDGQPIVVTDTMRIIKRDVDEDEAYSLCDKTSDKNIQAHLSDMPKELRSPEYDAFVKLLINGIKG